MITRRKLTAGPVAACSTLSITLCWLSLGWQAQAASPITPARPVPNLSDGIADLSGRLTKAQQERKEVLVELEKFRRSGTQELQFFNHLSADAIHSAVPRVEQLAQAEIWKAALLADNDMTILAGGSGQLPFTGRDNLGWYATLLEAAGEKTAAASIASYARFPKLTSSLVANIVTVDDAQRAKLFADLEQQLKDSPKDADVATAVEMVLRRKVGPDDLRSQLTAAATSVGDKTSTSLKMFLALAMRAERQRATESMLGKNEFHVTGELTDGSVFDAGSLSGKVIVVAFWSPRMPKCLAELPRLVKLYEQHHAAGLEIVAVNSDRGAKNLTEFLERHPEVKWPHLIDAHAALIGAPHPLARAAGIANYPTFFVIDRKGVLRSIDAAADLETLVASLLKEQ